MPAHPRRTAPATVGRRAVLTLGAAGVLAAVARPGAAGAGVPSGPAVRAPGPVARTPGPVTTRRTSTASRAKVGARRGFGLATAALPSDLGEVDHLRSALGCAPTELTYYAAWALHPDFVAADAARIADAGYVPEVVWEPWDPAAGLDQPRYSMASVAAGSHDAYLTRWARQVKAYGRPVVLRFAHEANGTWYPWAAGVNGNTTASYVAAWRRVVGVFQRVGATNVTWSWVQNVPYPGATPLAPLYPGDAHVGRVGLDGYNFGTTQSWSTWVSFATLFGAGTAELQRLTRRPVFIAETGCTEVGGSKAAWFGEAFAWLAQHPEVRGVSWFSLAKETDWRIDSSPASLDAFRAGIASFR